MITSIKFNNLFLISASTITGPKEKEGPLSEYFDISYQDLMAGESSYEKGEAKMIKQAIKLALQKAKLNDVDLIARNVLADYFKGIKPFEFIEEFKSLNINYANEIFKEVFKTENMVISIVK